MKERMGSLSLSLSLSLCNRKCLSFRKSIHLMQQQPRKKGFVVDGWKMEKGPTALRNCKVGR